MEVGDQKFISRNSDGFALSTVCVPFAFVPAIFPPLCDCCSIASSASSLIFDTTDVVELVTSRCNPNRLDKNHPVATGGGSVAVDPLPLRLVTAAEEEASLVKCPVKYGFGTPRRIDLGEPIGEAGNDFDPRRDIYLGLDMNSACAGSGAAVRRTLSG